MEARAGDDVERGERETQRERDGETESVTLALVVSSNPPNDLRSLAPLVFPRSETDGVTDHF